MPEVTKVFSKEFTRAVDAALLNAAQNSAACILIWRRTGFLDIRVKVDLTPATVGPTTIVFEETK